MEALQKVDFDTWTLLLRTDCDWLDSLPSSQDCLERQHIKEVLHVIASDVHVFRHIASKVDRRKANEERRKEDKGNNRRKDTAV